MWPILSGLLVVKVKDQARRYMLSLSFYIAAALCGVLAAAFLLAALWGELRDAYGNLAANLWFAGGFLLLALLTLLVRKIFFTQMATKTTSISQSLTNEVAAFKSTITPKRMLSILGAAGILGVFMGRHFRQK